MPKEIIAYALLLIWHNILTESVSISIKMLSTEQQRTQEGELIKSVELSLMTYFYATSKLRFSFHKHFGAWHMIGVLHIPVEWIINSLHGFSQ